MTWHSEDSAYGPRDRREAAAVSAAPGVLRANPLLPLAAFVMGLAWPGAYLIDGDAPGAAGTAVVLALLFGSMTLQGLYLLFLPIVRMTDDALVVRATPFVPSRRTPAEDIAWSPGARYAGSQLLRRGRDGGRPEKILDFWLLTRASQRRLFAWLDAHAVRPAGKASA